MTDISLTGVDDNALAATPQEQALAPVAVAKALIARWVVEGDADALHELRHRASAYELFNQRSGARDLANDAGEIKVRAERGLAQIDIQLAPRSVKREFRETKTHPPLEDFNPVTRADLRRLGTLSENEFERRLLAAKDDELAGVSTTRILLDQAPGGTKASVHVEWYTPALYLNAARDVLGGFDLDPASSQMANQTVKATQFFSADDDGLTRDWHGRVWLNPPYGKGSGLFTTKLVEEYTAGRVTAAILLLNAYGFDSGWFQPLWDHPICFTDHRVQFHSPQRETGGPANANIFVYLGPDQSKFAETFSQFGAVVKRIA